MGVEFGNVARDANYYLSQQSLTPTTFQGKTAKMLGIEGKWDEEQFRRLWDGQHPESGRMLHGMRNVANRVNAIDITFNHDKGSSVLRLLAKDERMEDVAKKARRKAMRMVEQQATVKVRKASAPKPKLRFPERHTGNILFVEFTHPDNRDGWAHWHTHVTVINATCDTQEGQFKTVNLFHLDKAAISDVYHREFAKGMRKLGYDAKWDGKTLEVGGVDKELCDAFSTGSKRAKATEARYAEKGLSPQGKRKVQLFDRPDKSPDMPLEARRRLWTERIRPDQFTGLSDLVKKAKSAVRRIAWRDNARMVVDRVRQTSMVRQVPERSRGNGWER